MSRLAGILEAWRAADRTARSHEAGWRRAAIEAEALRLEYHAVAAQEKAIFNEEARESVSSELRYWLRTRAR